MPDTAEAYTHRIGRTGRAAHTGDAFTLVTDEDTEMVRAIERVLGDADRAPHAARLRLQRARARAQRRVRPPAARAAPREGGPGCPDRACGAHRGAAPRWGDAPARAPRPLPAPAQRPAAAAPSRPAEFGPRPDGAPARRPRRRPRRARAQGSESA